MRLYIYLNKDIIKSIAAIMSDISFNIDIFEYSEKKGYTTNNNLIIRPELENGNKRCEDKNECYCRNRLDLSKENGNLCNYQVEKKYINIEDISNKKNNSFYYNILEKIPLDNRIKEIRGKITNLEETGFNIEANRFLMEDSIYNTVKELYENICDIVVIGYKINCLNEEHDVFKIIAVYIE